MIHRGKEGGKVMKKRYILVLLFLFIFLACSGISFAFLALGFQTEIGREREQAVLYHQSCIGELRRCAAEKRAETDKLLLSRQETEAMVLAFAEEIAGKEAGFEAVYNNSSIVDTLENNISEMVPDFALSVETADGRLQTVIKENKDAVYLLSGSLLKLDGVPYTIYTAWEVTENYAGYAARGRLTAALCVVGAALLALTAARYSRHTEGTLNNISEGMHRMTQGNYGFRVPPSGIGWNRDMAEHFNTMAEAVSDRMAYLQKSADNRKRFVDSLAHEMKTPLTSILGFADILRIKKTVDDKQRREFAAVIVEETKRLKSLSGKLLELATTDSVELEREWLSVPRLFEEIYVSMVPVLHQRRLTLSCDADGNAQIYADKELFKSLIYNLVENSVKASGDGQEIQLRCSVGRRYIRISVADHGIGMSEEHIKHVTEPFYMVDKSRSRKAGGAGLGLALCMEIARRHGARLSIQSVSGKGTTVTVTFPREESGAVSQ